MPAGDEVLPLIAAQLGVPTGHFAGSVLVDGPVRLDGPLRRLVAEADVLRLSAVTAGHQRIAAVHDPAIQHLDLRNEPDPLATAERWMRTEEDGPTEATAVHTVFDLGGRTLWHLRCHRVALDGHGFDLLARRLAALVSEASVKAGASPFRPLRDLVLAEAEYRRSVAFDQDRRYWLAAFADRPAVHRGRPPSGGGTARAAMPSSVPAPPLDLAIAATALRTYVHGGSTDVVVGVPTLGRLGSVAARVPARALNVLPLRLRIDATASVGALLNQVAGNLRGLRRHQRYRGEDLVRDLHGRPYRTVVGMGSPGVALSFAGHAARTTHRATGRLHDAVVTVENGRTCAVSTSEDAATFAGELAELLAGLAAGRDTPLDRCGAIAVLEPAIAPHGASPAPGQLVTR